MIANKMDCKRNQFGKVLEEVLELKEAVRLKITKIMEEGLDVIQAIFTLFKVVLKIDKEICIEVEATKTKKKKVETEK